MTSNRRAFLGAVGGLLAVGSADAVGRTASDGTPVTVDPDPDVVAALRAMDVDPDRPVADLFREWDVRPDASVAELVRGARETTA
jgi:hypothetical protein